MLKKGLATGLGHVSQIWKTRTLVANDLHVSLGQVSQLVSLSSFFRSLLGGSVCKALGQERAGPGAVALPALGEGESCWLFSAARDRPLRLTRWRVRVKRALNSQTDLPHAHP